MAPLLSCAGWPSDSYVHTRIENAFGRVLVRADTHEQVIPPLSRPAPVFLSHVPHLDPMLIRFIVQRDVGLSIAMVSKRRRRQTVGPSTLVGNAGEPEGGKENSTSARTRLGNHRRASTGTVMSKSTAGKRRGGKKAGEVMRPESEEVGERVVKKRRGSDGLDSRGGKNAVANDDKEGRHMRKRGRGSGAEEAREGGVGLTGEGGASKKKRSGREEISAAPSEHKDGMAALKSRRGGETEAPSPGVSSALGGPAGGKAVKRRVEEVSLEKEEEEEEEEDAEERQDRLASENPFLERPSFPGPDPTEGVGREGGREGGKEEGRGSGWFSSASFPSPSLVLRGVRRSSFSLSMTGRGPEDGLTPARARAAKEAMLLRQRAADEEELAGFSDLDEEVRAQRSRPGFSLRPVLSCIPFGSS